MHTRKACRLFALLLSMTLMLGSAVIGTTAYIADATPAVSNTFTFDPNDFPDEPTPGPSPTPAPFPELSLPDTGDHSALALWGAMLALSAGGWMILRRRAAWAAERK